MYRLVALIALAVVLPSAAFADEPRGNAETALAGTWKLTWNFTPFGGGTTRSCLDAGVALARAIEYRTRMPRYLHTSIFVSDMAASIDFYTNKMGLKLLGGPHHYPGNADMAFVGSSWDAYIELVYDLEDHPPYELGNRYEHLALEVDGDLPGVIEKLRAQGVKIVKEPKKSPGGTRAIAFVEDPNGIPVELLEPREGPVT